MNNEVLMGQIDRGWDGNGEGIKTITLCVTEACNLACTYCYMTGKNNMKSMNFKVAKDVVDYILENQEEFNSSGVVWDFIGGEPFLEIDLIDRICDYIKQKTFLMNHRWFNAYRFSFSSNGILYDTEPVQRFIEKNKGHIHIGLSVDGNKIKHDRSRIYADGTGSYDDVVKNVPLWQEQFPNVSTKATFSREDLPYLKDSIINLWNLGIKIVAANVVFEDVWQEGDDVIFENQLKDLADYIIENKLWNEVSVRFFDPTKGLPLSQEDKRINFCGAGKMLAVDCEGNFFPCIRFLDFSLSNKKGRKIGNAYDGINKDKVRAFEALDLLSQSDKKCIECQVATGCSWCTGANYDFARSSTIYQRSTYICSMHKANVRANEYFWNRYSEVTGNISPLEKNRLRKLGKLDERQKYLQFILEDGITPHCRYKNWKGTTNFMTKEVFQRGIEFSHKNNLIPIMLGESHEIDKDSTDEYLTFVGAQSKLDRENVIAVFDKDIDSNIPYKEIVILKVDNKDINKIYGNVEKIINSSSRINIVTDNIENWSEENINDYKNQLKNISDLLVKIYEEGKAAEVNVLTDRINLNKMDNCDCGEETYALGPNGKIYICPGFYFYDEDMAIGDIENGISINNEELMTIENSPICSQCDAYQCNRCKLLNLKTTDEINIPSQKQCKISHVEREESRILQHRLIDKGVLDKKNIINQLVYDDPLELLLSNK